MKLLRHGDRDAPSAGLPPFRDVIVLTASGLDEGAVLRCCMRLRQAMDQALRGYAPGGWQVLGPAPAAVAKVNNRYRYRLTLTGRNDQPSPGADRPPHLRAAHQDKDNRGVSVYADLDPYYS
ncbi:MAG: hypothetical protein V8S34_08030 [Lawsonibacter sp.]